MEIETCKWTLDSWNLTWITECGHKHFETEEFYTTMSINFEYCPYCGRKIVR
jgi:hypothetical protein